MWITLVFVVLLTAASVRWIRRRRSFHSSSTAPKLTQDMLRQIEENGYLGDLDDEPLDMEEIRREEEEFFSESWDEPEEYGR